MQFQFNINLICIKLEPKSLHLQVCVAPQQSIIERIIIKLLMSETLCAKCKKFFGNPQKLNMCSMCYKDHLNTQKIMSEASNFKIPVLPQPTAQKQADHSRCFLCKKKIGLLGIRCKGCQCFYCNGHRLPEDHKCEGNFIEMAKVEIKKNNPNITAPKIEKI